MPNKHTGTGCQTVTQAQFAAAGWSVGAIANHATDISGFIYVCDYRTDHFALYPAAVKDLKHSLDVEAGEISVLVADLVRRSQTGQLNADEQAKLLPALVSYALATQTYAEWLACAPAGQAFHFIINIYPTKTACTVRPFVYGTPKPVISAGDLEVISARVRETDLSQHPDWFKG